MGGRRTGNRGNGPIRLLPANPDAGGTDPWASDWPGTADPPPVRSEDGGFPDDPDTPPMAPIPGTALRLVPRAEPLEPNDLDPDGVLPLAPNPLIGRERELAAAVAEVRRGVRLLTLTGPGGVGKTRLAMAVADEVAASYPDGARFVDLAAVADAAAVAEAVARAVGVDGDEAMAASDRLRRWVRDRSLLLLLDNFEHVGAAAPLVADLLATAPGLAVVVTSRVPLRLADEVTRAVPPLAAPAPAETDLSLARLLAYPAVRLFTERAAAAAPEFRLDAARGAAIAAVCRRLDGLPLAIELAAARCRVLSPAELAARLDRALPLLSAPAGPDRQRTLRAAIAWSCGLLAPAEQALFRRLAVFVGGATLDAAEAVAAGIAADSADTVEGLHRLIDASLLQRTEDADGASRFRMLETIREFGLEQLAAGGDEDDARAAHAAWCLAFAERAGAELAGPNQVRWLRRIEAELPNIRAAHGYLERIGDVGRGLGLAAAVGWVWSSSGYFREGRTLFAGLVADPGAEQFPEALAEAMVSAGDIESWLGDSEAAERLYLRGLAAARVAGDQSRVVALTRGLGTSALDRSDLERAQRLLGEARALAERAGLAWEVAATTGLLGVVALARGNPADALALQEDARARWRAMGDGGHEAVALRSLGLAALAAGDLSRSAAAYAESLALTEADDEVGLASVVQGAAGLALAGGDAARATRLFAAAAAGLARQGTPPFPVVRAWRDERLALARRRLGERAFAEETALGSHLPIEDACQEAREVFAAASGEPQDGLAARYGLSPREAEVLRLLADGRADKEIAATLGISRSTASNHVAAIRDKLGVPSRTAAAALVLREGEV